MRQIISFLTLLSLLTLGGTIGFRIVVGADWIESLYLAVITITTVGYREPVPLSDAGKLFVVAYLFVSLGIFTYSVSQIGQWVVNSRLRLLIERRRMDQTINALRNHHIVCGLGRMGMTICEHLAGRGKEFVVIDRDAERLRETGAANGWLYLAGDATDDEVLKKAGAQEARSLATVLPTDADNIYVVLTASMLAPELQIVARASEETAIQKMEHAGASRVISPYNTGAVKIARFMLSSTLEDFIEIADSRGSDLELADFQITDGSPYIGKKLMETNLRAKGVMIVGIRREDGERLMPPSGEAVIRTGDSLFAFGSSAAVQRMLTDIEPEDA